MKVRTIYIYPVKSMKGISIEKAFLRQEGILFDRRWMLVDENGKFLSQRELPLLSQFATKLSKQTLSISYKNSQIEIPANHRGFPSMVIHWSPYTRNRIALKTLTKSVRSRRSIKMTLK